MLLLSATNTLAAALGGVLRRCVGPRVCVRHVHGFRAMCGTSSGLGMCSAQAWRLSLAQVYLSLRRPPLFPHACAGLTVLYTKSAAKCLWTCT